MTERGECEVPGRECLRAFWIRNSVPFAWMSQRGGLDEDSPVRIAVTHRKDDNHDIRKP